MTCLLQLPCKQPEQAGHFHISKEDAQVFVARAFKQYVSDIEAELRTGKNPETYAEYSSALDDFTGQRHQLARLCRLSGLELAQVVAMIEQVL